jgi:hypothetical protein
MALSRCFRPFLCSQNKTLQTLQLSRNQIGDAGAASIGAALAYVQPRLPK